MIMDVRSYNAFSIVKDDKHMIQDDSFFFLPLVWTLERALNLSARVSLAHSHTHAHISLSLLIEWPIIFYEEKNYIKIAKKKKKKTVSSINQM